MSLWKSRMATVELLYSSAPVSDAIYMKRGKTAVFTDICTHRPATWFRHFGFLEEKSMDCTWKKSSNYRAKQHKLVHGHATTHSLAVESNWKEGRHSSLDSQLHTNAQNVGWGSFYLRGQGGFKNRWQSDGSDFIHWSKTDLQDYVPTSQGAKSRRRIHGSLQYIHSQRDETTNFASFASG